MRSSILFSCASCDAQFPKWSGRCLQCGAWGTLAEIVPPVALNHGSVGSEPRPPAPFMSLDQVSAQAVPRLATNIAELDRVFGGGIVPGSLILLGGEPGIGKSTLVLQIVAALSFPPSSAEGGGQVGDRNKHPLPNPPLHKEEEGKNAVCLYVCGEERPEQIVGRAQRLGATLKNLNFVSAGDILSVIATARQIKPALIIIDSIQTVFHPEVAGAAGTVRQVQAVTSQLLAFSKETGTTVLLIGHVTKEGVVAGPKTLEHLVDVVLSFEGERTEPLRLLRGIKNRFGATHEVGLFAMTETGLHELRDATSLTATSEPASGVARTMIMEGSRPIPIEVQVLVSRTVFGYPQRRAVGFDANRLQLLLAVLGEHAGLSLAQYDVHVNVVGGFSVREPAADLALCAALISARTQKILPADLVLIGEVGLTGGIRPVRSLEIRLAEARRCGGTQFIIPQTKNASTHVGAQLLNHVRELQSILGNMLKK